MLNQVLLNSAKYVINSDLPTLFNIDVVFTNSSPGSTFNLSPFRIEEIVFNKDYAGNFADEIFLTTILSPKDFALLQDQGQSLRCELTFTFLDKFSNVSFKLNPVKKSYNVFLTNPKDIRKSVPDVQNYTEPSMKTTIQLIEDTVYSLKKTKLNKIFTKCDMKSVIHDLVNDLGIKKLYLVKPDNEHVYDHVELETYLGIESLFVFLQTKYGVYAKGLNVYISDGCCYIYPPFETNPAYDKTLGVYQVSVGMFGGVACYHNNLANIVSVVINTEAKDYDLSISGAENNGTGFMFSRASRMADGLTTIDSKTGAQFTEKPSLKATLTDAKPLIPDSSNLKVIKPTDNPYPELSKLQSTQASLLKMNWQNANPFLLDPCYTVGFYYDSNGNQMTKTGIQESASYRVVRTHRAGDKDVFACNGELILRLSPKAKQVF
jgi:hypothetical protein